MIKEILKKNGVQCYTDFLYRYYITELPEFLAQQYVKDYGFKLSWFNDCDMFYLHTLKNEELNFDWLDYYLIRILDYNKKIVCWLYANDIKIINDLEG